MTLEEKMDQDATSLVDLWARVFTLLQKQCTGLTNKTLLNVATELSVAEIRKNGAHSR